jgi:hypothetical protein
MLRPYVGTLQKVITDDGNEFMDLFQSTLRAELELPGLQFVRISKEGLSQIHPGKLSPVETAVHSVREHLEKYRRLYTDPIIPNQMGCIGLFPLSIVQKIKRFYTNTLQMSLCKRVEPNGQLNDLPSTFIDIERPCEMSKQRLSLDSN